MGVEQGKPSADFDQVSAFLRSPLFLKFLQSRNLSGPIVAETQAIIASPPERLAERAQDLVNRARQALADFYSLPGDIVIPFSGGRDSSLIAGLTVDLSIPNKTVHLITALTGYGVPSEKPQKRGLELARRNGTTVYHHNLDISHLTGTYVVDTAYQDREMLGYPGFCAGCKVVMEKAVTEAAVQLGATHIPWGYARYQADQQWPEQSLAQQTAMQSWLSRQHPGLHIGSPLFEILEFPVDPILMLTALGYPPDQQESEGKCVAAGLNPQKIDQEVLAAFVTSKQQELPPLINPVFASTPNQDLAPAVRTLKQDPKLRRGCFQEPTIFDFSAPDQQQTINNEDL